MTRALIGNSGFVGGNLLRQSSFDALYNSSTIQSIRGKFFDDIWCAGVHAVKWFANLNPEIDKKSIAPLLDALSTVQCNKFILFSTVDVFSKIDGMNEMDIPDKYGLQPYGRHRLEVEEFVMKNFINYTIVRLPGIFGEGLKKNIIYDFLNNNNLERIHADSVFQFYDLCNIYTDCHKAMHAGLNLIHFAVEPVSVEEIAREAFGLSFANKPKDIVPARYDLQSIHAKLWGRSGSYLQSKKEVLERLRLYIRKARGEAF